MCRQNGVDTIKTDLADDISKDCLQPTFQNARHKDKYQEIRGNVMMCKDCGVQLSTVGIVISAVESRQKTALYDSVHDLG